MPLLRTLLLNLTLGVAAYGIARDAFSIRAGLARGLAAVVLGWAWATLGMEVLGSCGWLSYGPLLGWSVAGLVIAGFFRHRAASRTVPTGDMPPSSPPPARSPRWEPEAIVAVGLVVWATLIHGLPSLLGPVKVVSDGPIYHLYFAAQWWKSGRLALVAAPFGESVVSYFPAVGDLWFTWLLVGWGGDLLAKLGQVPFLLAAAVAAYGCARRVGASVSAAVMATAWFASIFPFLLFTLEPNVDTIFVAAYLLAAYFFLLYALGDEGESALALGAIAAGGVLGTKPTGIVFGGLLLGTAGLTVLVRQRTGHRRLGHLAVLAFLPLVMVGSWYGRNLWLTGNPLYPLHVRALGRVWLAGWYGSDVMQMSPFYIPMGDWRSLVDILLAVFDPRLFPVWMAALLGAGVWIERNPGRHVRPAVWGFSALAVANLAVYWVLVPYRTQQRFMFQAIGLMVVPLACLFDRGRWIRMLALVLLVIHHFTAQSWPLRSAGEPPAWDLTSLIPNEAPPPILFRYLIKLAYGLPADPGDVSSTLLVLALGAVALAGAWLWSRPGRRARITAGAVSLSLLAIAIGLALAAGQARDPRLAFYPNFAPYYRGWLQLDARSGRAGTRIAYAGTNLPYYLLGLGLRNHLEYVNINNHQGWLMHDYHRLAQRRGEPTWPSPWPGWDRLERDYDAWLANLRSARIDLLVVASMRRPLGSLPDQDREEFPIERRWAETHPESFEPLYGAAEHDPKFRIYRVRPVPITNPFPDLMRR